MTLEELNEIAKKHNLQTKELCLTALTTGNTPEIEAEWEALRKLDKYIRSLELILYSESRNENAIAEPMPSPFTKRYDA